MKKTTLIFYFSFRNQ